jgi:hypothetical protein
MTPAREMTGMRRKRMTDRDDEGTFMENLRIRMYYPTIESIAADR